MVPPHRKLPTDGRRKPVEREISLSLVSPPHQNPHMSSLLAINCGGSHHSDFKILLIFPPRRPAGESPSGNQRAHKAFRAFAFLKLAP